MFAGILDYTQTTHCADQLIQLSKTGLASIPFEDQQTWQGSFSKAKLTLIQQRWYNTSASLNEQGIIQHSASNTQILAWARIDNRHELKSRLQDEFNELTQSDTGLILASYLTWGVDCCQHLVGDFSFTIIDHRQQLIHCARDHTGVRPLYIYHDNNRLVFATSLAVFSPLPDIDLSLSENWLAHFLSGYPKDWTLTPYHAIKRCPPAHILTYKDKNLHHHQYFKFNPEITLTLKDDREYVDAYRELLWRSVSCRVMTEYPIGAELSGGLDSSTISSIAAFTMKKPGMNLHTFGFDEQQLTAEFVAKVARRLPIKMSHFIPNSGRHVDAIVEKFISVYGSPYEHPNGISHAPFYETCESLGIRSLLSGFGGDEFVTSQAPVALVEFLTNRDWSNFYSRQRGSLITRPIHTARWLYNYYRHDQQSISSRGLHNTGNINWSMGLFSAAIAKQYSLRENANRYLDYDYGFTRQNDFSIENRWSPFMTLRYENCVLIAAKYGIEYSWPLMDIRLLNFFLSVPTEQKLGPGMVGRYLHRRAVSRLLPKEITWGEKSMRGLNTWQKFIELIKRKPLPEVNLQRTTNPPTPTKVIDSDKPTLHPMLENIVDAPKIDDVYRIYTDNNANHYHKLLAGSIMRQYKCLYLWLDQQTGVIKSDK